MRPGEKVKLREWPTIVKPLCKSKKEYQEALEEHVAALSSLQRIYYASNRYAMLLIFQGMDAAGKDGAIRHVMSGVNPQGCQVFSFKQPSADELERDFLWRTTRCLPERGQIGIFNRSYYEEVLVVRVHPEILRNQGLSEELRDEKTIWEGRYRSIVDLESHLHRNGTRIIKVFLHLSKEEQRKRFLWATGGSSVFVLRQIGTAVTGEIQGRPGQPVYKIVDGVVRGNQIHFFVMHQDPDDPEVKANGNPFHNFAKGTFTEDEIDISGSRENTDIREYHIVLNRIKDK